MRVVVVGGTGNISTSIVNLLLHQGHDVTVLSRGTRPVPDGARPLIGDRNDREWFETTMREADFEVAIDMMAFTLEDAESSLRAFAGVRQLIQTSTIMVYGDSTHFLLSTEEHPALSTAAYGRQKAEIDAFYLDAHARDGFPVTILRPSFAYGGRGFPIFRQVGATDEWISRMRAGKPLIVCADGLPLIRFLHVDDAALAYAAALKHPETIGQVYNLVDPRLITWADYHQAAMTAVGREVELISVPFATLRDRQIPGFGMCETVTAYHWAHEDSKIRRDLPEFQPSVPLAVGIASTIEVAEREGRIPAAGTSAQSTAATTAGTSDWEDELIAELRTG